MRLFSLSAGVPRRQSSRLMPRRSLANTITLLRIFLSAPGPLLLLQGSLRALIASAIICGIGALSDVLDGYLARHRGEISGFGTLMDPIADKVFVDGYLAVLVLHGVLVPQAVGVLVLRDLVVTFSRAKAANQGWMSTPARLAKAKSFLLYVGAFSAMLGLLTHGPVLVVARIPVYGGIALAIVTGAQYLSLPFARYLKKL